MTPSDPRQFFDTYVKPSYDAWLKDQENFLLASCAVHQANVMLERLLWHKTGGKLSGKEFEKHVCKERPALAKTHSDFALVRDVDNTHKHLVLRDRPSRPASPQSYWHWWGLFGEGGVSEIVVKQDDGTYRPLAVILKNVIGRAASASAFPVR